MSKGEKRSTQRCGARAGITVGQGKKGGPSITGEAAGEVCAQPDSFTESCQTLQGEELERK